MAKNIPFSQIPIKNFFFIINFIPEFENQPIQDGGSKMTNQKINKIEFNRVKLATWEIFGITGLDSNNDIRKLAYRRWWIKIDGSNVANWKISNIKRYQFKLGALEVFGIADVKSYNDNWKLANPRCQIQDGESDTLQ